MAKASKRPKVEAPENKNIGIAMNRLAAQTAVELEPIVAGTLETLSDAREDWEGGKFAVMHKITKDMPEEKLALLPDPKVKTGNNPAHYKVEKFRDGKSAGWREVYFYDQLALDLPGVMAMGKTIDQLSRSLLDPAKVFTGDIGPDIKNMAIDYRRARIKRLQRRINNAKSNVVGAFELRNQLIRFNEELKHVDASVIFAVGPDGSLLDGQEGRSFEVEPTQTPIIVASTVKGREDIDKVHVSIGTFLAYDIDKAIEGNGTYAAVMETVKREKPDDQGDGQNPQGNAQNQSLPQRVNTPDTFFARMTDTAEFIDKLWSEKTRATEEQCINLTHGAGSDDAFVSARTTLEFLKTLVGGPKDDIRWQAHINEDKEHPLHKAA